MFATLTARAARNTGADHRGKRGPGVRLAPSPRPVKAAQAPQYRSGSDRLANPGQSRARPSKPAPSWSFGNIAVFPPGQARSPTSAPLTPVQPGPPLAMDAGWSSSREPFVSSRSKSEAIGDTSSRMPPAKAPGQPPSGPVPAEAPAGSKTPIVPDCERVEKAEFKDIPSGTVRANLHGTELRAAFSMAALFAARIPCNCHCGEYRQYIRGTVGVNDVAKNVPIGGNRVLDPTAFQEDGELVRGTTHLAYGHRAWPGTDNSYKPDQEGGCRFQGKDMPHFAVLVRRSGTKLAMDLDFRGDLIDTCRSDKVLAASSWKVVGSGTVA